MRRHLALRHSDLLRLSLVLACSTLACLTSYPQSARAADASASCPSALQLTDLNDARAGMVLIPGGVFVMGSDRHQPEERYTHLVRVDPFWMSAHEVTNAEFAAFVRATGYVTEAERPQSQGAAVFVAPSEVNGRNDTTQWWQFKKDANWRSPQGGGSSIAGKENHPVVNVTLRDAQAYATWRGHTLPTEAEWEHAAQGGQFEPADTIGGYEDGKPVANTWQGIFPVLNTAEDGFVGTSPVGCFKPNAYGLYDMIGNVWEWTTDWFQRRHERYAAVNPGGPSAPVLFDASRAASKVIKGGSFLCASNYCARYRASARQPQEADLGTSHIGFRTVLRATGP